MKHLFDVWDRMGCLKVVFDGAIVTSRDYDCKSSCKDCLVASEKSFHHHSNPKKHCKDPAFLEDLLLSLFLWLLQVVSFRSYSWAFRTAKVSPALPRNCWIPTDFPTPVSPGAEAQEVFLFIFWRL